MPFAPRPPFGWKLRTRTLELGPRTLLMAILNVTPDSFSDGGLDATPQDAIHRGLEFLDAGADLLDLGGESTRPNASPISSEEELTRVMPVLTGILEIRPTAILSIDTYHAATARVAVEAGAEIVNDVSGHLWDSAMSRTCAALGCGNILMHTRGRPTEWSSLPAMPPETILPHVLSNLQARLAEAVSAGIEGTSIAIDPGFGFGILGEANFTLLAQLDRLGTLGFPLVAGVSRKRFLASHLPPPRPTQTIAANTAALLAGAHLLRVHDLQAAQEAAAIADAILAAR